MGAAGCVPGREADSLSESCKVCTFVHTFEVVQWDRSKAAANLDKHGVDFADAATVLEDDFALTVEDDDHDEQRFVTIGADALGRVLVVVYIWRDDEPRLVSARGASRSERRQYEEGGSDR